MENNFLDNPWNLKCQSFKVTTNVNKSKIFIQKEVFGGLSYLKSLPHLFSRTEDLVSCKICHILICKNICLKHAKLHDLKNEDVDLIYTVSTKIETDFIFNDLNSYDDTPKKIGSKSMRSKSVIKNKDKKRKISDDKSQKLKTKSDNQITSTIKCEENMISFVPKSILNASNPLRIKIQLQPKLEAISKNGNIFENLQNFFPNSNLSKNIFASNEVEMITTPIDLTVASPRKDSKNITKPHNVINVHKYQQYHQNSNLVKPVNFSDRTYTTIPVVNHNGPQNLPYYNQTSAFPSRMSLQSPQLSKPPQVFQTHRTGQISGKIFPKKHVDVKSLRETLLPVSSTQSLNSYTNNLDDNQISFQKILIDNGMFSQEDILRCRKSSSALDISHSGKVKRITHLSVPNSSIRPFQSNPTFSRSSSQLYPHMLNSQPYSQNPPTLNIVRSNPLLTTQSLKSNIRKYNTHHNENMELSDDEFCLDQTLIKKHNSQGQHSVPVHYTYPNSDLLKLSKSHSSNDFHSLSHQVLTMPSTAREEYLDNDVHYLPPPEETIKSLSWEL